MPLKQEPEDPLSLEFHQAKRSACYIVSKNLMGNIPIIGTQWENSI